MGKESDDEKGPEFIYGPKDGAKVPPMLWILDQIKLEERRSGAILVHKYNINMDNKNYYYAGYEIEDDSDG